MCSVRPDIWVSTLHCQVTTTAVNVVRMPFLPGGAEQSHSVSQILDCDACVRVPGDEVRGGLPRERRTSLSGGLLGLERPRTVSQIRYGKPCVIDGWLPKLGMWAIDEWAELHRVELAEAWEDIRQRESTGRDRSVGVDHRWNPHRPPRHIGSTAGSV